MVSFFRKTSIEHLDDDLGGTITSETTISPDFWCFNLLFMKKTESWLCPNIGWVPKFDALKPHVPTKVVTDMGWGGHTFVHHYGAGNYSKQYHPLIQVQGTVAK